MIVVSAVKDTGLCGSYWGNTENLGSTRRSSVPTALEILKATQKMKKTSDTKKKVITKLQNKKHQQIKPRKKVFNIKAIKKK